MFVNIQDAWKRNVRVFGSSLHLIHFNDMWRRASQQLRTFKRLAPVGTRTNTRKTVCTLSALEAPLLLKFLSP